MENNQERMIKEHIKMLKREGVSRHRAKGVAAIIRYETEIKCKEEELRFIQAQNQAQAQNQNQN